MMPDNYLLLDGKIPLFHLRFFCPKSGFSPSAVEYILRSIEDLIPGIDISWKLIFSIRTRRINGVLTEVHDYKNVSVGNDRLKFLTDLKAKQEFGENTFWNGDLENHVEFKFILKRISLPGVNTKNNAGFSIVIRVAQHLVNFDRLFLTIALASKAQYLSENPVNGVDQLSYINKALERNFYYYDARFPAEEEATKELANSLPHLKSVMHVADLQAAPRILWHNYWDSETAKFYNFPDPQQDERIMPLAQQLPNGGWRFYLTKDPLDILRQDHRDAIIWAYRRFKPVGMPAD